MFDLTQTVQAAAQSAIVVEPTVYALTTLAGKFGLSGKGQLAFGVVCGGGFGAAGYIAQVGGPVDFAGWTALVLFTLLAALVPAGVYEANKEAASKGASVDTYAEPPQ
jgi:hypothetical protein